MRAPALLVLILLACSSEPKEAPPLDVGSLPPLPSGHIRGELAVKPELAPNVTPGDTIYLMARNAATGGILAVKKLSAPPKFPLSFELTGQDVMMPGQSLAGRVQLSARVDKDGNATTKTPGDVVGEVAGLVDVPNEGVVLTLDRQLE